MRHKVAAGLLPQRRNRLPVCMRRLPGRWLGCTVNGLLMVSALQLTASWGMPAVLRGEHSCHPLPIGLSLAALIASLASPPAAPLLLRRGSSREGRVKGASTRDALASHVYLAIQADLHTRYYCSARVYPTTARARLAALALTPRSSTHARGLALP